MQLLILAQDILPHSFLLGHLPVAGEVAKLFSMPPDAYGHRFPILIAQLYPGVAAKGACYLDLWPTAPPILAVYHPDMMAQFTQDDSQPKYHGLQTAFKPFTQNDDLVSANGSEWKSARAIFNPGFSQKNLRSLVSSFVEESLVFRDRMREFARTGEMFKMDDYTTTVTVDIIGRAALGVRFHAQQKPVALLDAMLQEVRFVYFNLEPSKRFYPLRGYYHWLYHRRFRNEIMPYVRETALNWEKLEGPKTILALALKHYVEEVDYSARGNIPPAFLEKVVNHMKMFLFAGHDTTATTLSYCYYMLGCHPDAAKKVCRELDELLGDDVDDAPRVLSENPALLNQMPYTSALVKETLRLFPVAGTNREPSRGLTLTVPETGEQLPTNGFMLFSTSTSCHRNPAFWPEPDRFILERWTVPEDDPLHPVKNAYRPFEMGPRNCIGQELASLELRLILALTARDFDVQAMYSDDAPRFCGEPAYQVQPETSITPHPKDGLPVRLRPREKAGRKA